MASKNIFEMSKPELVVLLKESYGDMDLSKKSKQKLVSMAQQANHFNSVMKKYEVGEKNV